MSYGCRILDWEERKTFGRAFGHAWANNGHDDARAAESAWAYVIAAARDDRGMELLRHVEAVRQEPDSWLLPVNQSTSQPVNQSAGV